uniref:Uncharacterized protein n=1 Tax=Rhizophora mucronata TaxID=61149 RepID=A0A2P2QJ74_RHIMU
MACATWWTCIRFMNARGASKLHKTNRFFCLFRIIDLDNLTSIGDSFSSVVTWRSYLLIHFYFQLLWGQGKK